MSSLCVLPDAQRAFDAQLCLFPLRENTELRAQLTLPSPLPRASTAPLRTSESLGQAADKGMHVHVDDAMPLEVARCRADSASEKEETVGHERESRAPLSPARVSPSPSQATAGARAAFNVNNSVRRPSESNPRKRSGETEGALRGLGVGADENASVRLRLGSGFAPVSPHAAPGDPSVRGKLDAPSRGEPRGPRATVRDALDAPERGIPRGPRATAPREEHAAPFAGGKKRKLSGETYARAAAEVHARDDICVERISKKRSRNSIEGFVQAVRDVFRAGENAAVSPARGGDTPRRQSVPEASHAGARGGSDADDDEEVECMASLEGVAKLEAVAIGALKPPPGTPATPVTPAFRRRLIAASFEGLRRVRSGDFSPQVSRISSKKDLDALTIKAGEARGNSAQSAKTKLEMAVARAAHRAINVVSDEYERVGGNAHKFATVFQKWANCCEAVMTTRLRELADAHAKAGRSDSPEIAVYALVQVIGDILRHGGYLRHDEPVDKFVNATVVDDTIFAADGETHHPQGHLHRAGVSTGETKQHQDQSVHGITVVFSKVIDDEYSHDVSHVFKRLHHEHVLFAEGAFRNMRNGSGSHIQDVRQQFVVGSETYANTENDAVRVMTLSPVENAYHMHGISNPKGVARVVIQLVIDPGFGLVWAEGATQHLRAFLGQRLANTTVEKVEVNAEALNVLSKIADKVKCAELPLLSAEAKAAKEEKAAKAAARAALAKAAKEEKAAKAAARAALAKAVKEVKAAKAAARAAEAKAAKEAKEAKAAKEAKEAKEAAAEAASTHRATQTASPSTTFSSTAFSSTAFSSTAPPVAVPLTVPSAVVASPTPSRAALESARRERRARLEATSTVERLRARLEAAESSAARLATRAARADAADAAERAASIRAATAESALATAESALASATSALASATSAREDDAKNAAVRFESARRESTRLRARVAEAERDAEDARRARDAAIASARDADARRENDASNDASTVAAAETAAAAAEERRAAAEATLEARAREWADELAAVVDAKDRLARDLACAARALEESEATRAFLRGEVGARETRLAAERERREAAERRLRETRDTAAAEAEEARARMDEAAAAAMWREGDLRRALEAERAGRQTDAEVARRELDDARKRRTADDA